MVWLAVLGPSAISWWDRRLVDLKKRMRAADPRRSTRRRTARSKDYWARIGHAG